jgi:hypothetical protein
MTSPEDYDFVKVSIKKDIAQQIDVICNDLQKECGLFVSKSELLKVMTYDKNVIEYVVKKILYEKKNGKSSDYDVFKNPTL